MNQVNIENIKVGDKFSTEQKLLLAVGFQKTKSNDSKKSQIKELQRYLTYKKTGKILRGKITSEIIISEIFEEVKPKIDGRTGKGNNTNTGKYRQYLMPLLKLISLQSTNNEYHGGYSIYVLCNSNNLGVTNSSAYIKPIYEDCEYYDADDEEVITYKNHMKRVIKKSVQSTLEFMKKTYKGFYYQLTWACDGNIADEKEAEDIYEILKNCQTDVAKANKFRQFSYIFSKKVDASIRKSVLIDSYDLFLKSVAEKYGFEKMQEVFIIRGAEAEFKDEVNCDFSLDCVNTYTPELKDLYRQVGIKYIEKNQLTDNKKVTYAHDMLFFGYRDVVIGDTFDVSDFDNIEKADKQLNIQLYKSELKDKSELDRLNKKVVNGDYAVNDDGLY